MPSRSLYGALLTFVRSLSVYGVKVTGVFYDFFHSLHVKFSCIYIHIITYSIYVFSRENGWWGGGGGVMNLVYGSSSSSYMDCEVNFVWWTDVLAMDVSA